MSMSRFRAKLLTDKDIENYCKKIQEVEGADFDVSAFKPYFKRLNSLPDNPPFYVEVNGEYRIPGLDGSVYILLSTEKMIYIEPADREIDPAKTRRAALRKFEVRSAPKQTAKQGR